MDNLGWKNGLGGAINTTLGYSRNALTRTNDQGAEFAIVRDRAFSTFGFAASYDRFRLHLAFEMPLVVKGESGTAQGFHYTGTNLDLKTHPDVLTDVKIGFDVRIFGWHYSPFRMGLGAQLFIPNGARDDYNTDQAYRAMLRYLIAGDHSWFTYAAHIGVHFRQQNDATSNGPQGSEGLFGAAAGAKFELAPYHQQSIIVGPEVFGATAFRSFFGSSSTASELLLTARYEHTRDNAAHFRVRLGAGIGLNREFGAPEQRGVLSVEVFGRVTRPSPNQPDPALSEQIPQLLHYGVRW